MNPGLTDVGRVMASKSPPDRPEWNVADQHGARRSADPDGRPDGRDTVGHTYVNRWSHRRALRGLVLITVRHFGIDRTAACAVVPVHRYSNRYQTGLTGIPCIEVR